MSEPLPDPWRALRRFTAARIALGHRGVSQPTAVQLEFQLAHARARDAVHQPFDAPELAQSLQAAWPGAPLPLILQSAAQDRHVYLQRPDLGRRLDARSRAMLEPLGHPCDLAVVVADGLSARAVAQNAAPLLQALHTHLAAEALTLAPITIIEQGRVAIGDEVGELLGAQLVIVLIGERPGLSSPDSMGIYMTWAPHVGLTDESRNCISNVRPAGLSYRDAAARLHYLLTQARGLAMTGIGLKDESSAESLTSGAGPAFLL